MKKILAILLVLCCVLPAMAKKRQNEEIITPLTQLEKRQYQTRTYQAQDNVIAMKSILNVLQDEGFIVYNVNSLLGYIYGVKDFDISDPNIDISKEFGLTKSRLNYNGVKVATLEVSVNVTQYGDISRIRVNFKRKLFNEYGNAQMIDDIEDASYYDEFYKKVDTAINLQKQIQHKTQNPEPVTEKKPILKSKSEFKNPQSAKKIQNVESLDIKKEEHRLDVDESLNDVRKETIEPENVQNSSDSESMPAEEKVSLPEEKINKLEDNKTEYENFEEISSKEEKEHSKELKEAISQAKEEARQAEKEARQAQKEAIQAEKEAQKEARQAQKEVEKELKRQIKVNQE